MLEISNLDAWYGRIQALNAVSLRLSAGEIVTVIGANGAGKSSLLRSISGTIPRRTGTILFNGTDIVSSPPHAIVRAGIAQVPEGRRIFAPLTVDQNLEVGAFTRFGHVPRSQIERRREFVFQLFPRLIERRQQAAGTLSGGEQQMLAIARALMAEPALLLLDEPSIGLAPQIIAQIFDALTTLNRAGLSILLVEQNVNLALEVADRAYVMSTGRVQLSGHATELRDSSHVRSIYLGGQAPMPVVGNDTQSAETEVRPR